MIEGINFYNLGQGSIMISNETKANIDQRVAVVRCNSYSKVKTALMSAMEYLGGLNQFCKPDQHLLLKPNLLLGDNPIKGTATHPAFFAAVSEVLKTEGVNLYYGDSPAVGTPEMAVRNSGLSAVADVQGIELVDFVNVRDISNPEGQLIKQFRLAQGLEGMDGIINLPKMKTHGLMRLTGAVKNLFGCLPGVQKAAFHARLKNEFFFAEMLVDLAELLKPRLHIIDGVLGMEGNGPRNGEMRPIGVILVSTNPHALDHCFAQIINLDPNLVPTLQVAQSRSLYNPEEIEILGEPISAFVIEDFNVNRSKASTTGTQKFYMNLFRDLATRKPVINEEKCTKCGRCVRVCPAKPKALRFSNGREQSPGYAYEHCIRCYCCQEVCPDEAIYIKTPFLGRLIEKIKV